MILYYIILYHIYTMCIYIYSIYIHIFYTQLSIAHASFLMTWVINQQQGHIFAGFNRLDVDHTGKVSLHNFRTCLMDIFAEHPDASHTVLLAKFCQEAFNHVSGYSSLDSIWVVSADVSTFHTFPCWKGCLVVFTGESDGCLSMFQLDPMNDTQACLVPCLVSGGEWR